MRLPSAWDLIKLCLCAAAFGWRIERWGNGDALSGAVFWAVVVVLLAYGIWAMGRIEIEEE